MGPAQGHPARVWLLSITFITLIGVKIRCTTMFPKIWAKIRRLQLTSYLETGTRTAYRSMVRQTDLSALSVIFSRKDPEVYILLSNT